MAQVGCLGDIVFRVSDKQVETIEKVQWSGSARYAEHQRHMGNALTEFLGLTADKISFDMQLSTYLGIDPMAELVKVWQYEREGRALPLIIGEKPYGKYRWVIESHKTQLQQFGKSGKLFAATVSISLLEYLSA